MIVKATSTGKESLLYWIVIGGQWLLVGATKILGSGKQAHLPGKQANDQKCLSR